jgi:PAS domain S-box-containing protein
VEGNAIIFNKATENITGYLNSEISNLDDWFKTLYGKDHEKIRAQYEEDRKAGFPIPRIIALKRKHGEGRFVEFAAYKDEKAEVWLLHDVTERKRLEKMILEVTKKEQQRIGEELHEGLAQHLTMTAIAGKILGQIPGFGPGSFKSCKNDQPGNCTDPRTCPGPLFPRIAIRWIPGSLEEVCLGDAENMQYPMCFSM